MTRATTTLIPAKAHSPARTLAGLDTDGSQLAGRRRYVAMENLAITSPWGERRR